MDYGNKLNPERSLQASHGIKGTRQKVIVTHNPSVIVQSQVIKISTVVDLEVNISKTYDYDSMHARKRKIGRYWL